MFEIIYTENSHSLLAEAMNFLQELGIEDTSKMDAQRAIAYYVALYGYGKAIGEKIKTLNGVNGCIKNILNGDIENVDEGYCLHLAILCAEKAPNIEQNIAQQLQVDMQKVKNIYYAGIYLSRYIMYIDTEFYRICEDIASKFVRKYNGFDIAEIEYPSKVQEVIVKLNEDMEFAKLYSQYNTTAGVENV